MNLIHTYISSYSPLLTLYTNIIILRKSYSPQKGSHHTYLNILLSRKNRPKALYPSVLQPFYLSMGLVSSFKL